jgi:asparagine synthase (glutamine-hydrolysing)
VWSLDEPYAGGLPSWYVFRLMSEDVKVGLTGPGGDEDFGNYGKFRFFESSRVARMLLRAGAGYERASESLGWLWRPLHTVAAGLPERWIGQTRKQRLTDGLNFDGGVFGRYFFNPFYYLSDAAKRSSVFRIEQDGIPDTADLLSGIFKASGSPSLRDAVAYTDFHTQLPDEFLHMTDRLSMAHSLEARVPFLDHRFVELVFRIPASLRTRAGDLKYLFKRAVGDLLPPAVLQGGKRGFVIPIKLWLRDPLRPLVERLLSENRLRQQGIFRPEFNRRFVRPHLAGHADYTWQIWAALMFQLWHQVFIEGPADGVPAWSWRDLT